MGDLSVLVDDKLCGQSICLHCEILRCGRGSCAAAAQFNHPRFLHGHHAPRMPTLVKFHLIEVVPPIPPWPSFAPWALSHAKTSFISGPLTLDCDVR